MQDKQEVLKAKVVEITKEGLKDNTGIDKEIFFQEIKAKIISGEEKGKIFSIFTINREIFATEIIRTLVGSIGLVLAVPITTIISVYMLNGREFKNERTEHHSHVH